MDAIVQKLPNPEYSENLLPIGSVILSNATTINKTGGTAGSSATWNAGRRFISDYSLHLISDSASTLLTYNLGTLLGHTVDRPGKYWVTMCIEQDQNPLSYVPHELTINIIKDGVYNSDNTIKCTLPTADDPDDTTENLDKDLFYIFEGSFEVSSLEVPCDIDYTFEFKGVNVALGNAEIWIDGMKTEYAGNNSNRYGSSVYTRPKPLPVLTATSTLNFGSLVANAEADLAIALTGAVVGKPVILSAPSTLQGDYRAFCATANIITVRAINTTGSTYDPPSASITVTQ